MHAVQLSGVVPRISRTCGGVALPALWRADRIQFYLCGVALGGRRYARASHVDSTNRKILQNHVSVSIWESHHGVKYKMADSEVEALINAVHEFPSL